MIRQVEVIFRPLLDSGHRIDRPLYSLEASAAALGSPSGAFEERCDFAESFLAAATR